MDERQDQLDTLNTQLELYRQVYLNLTVFGQTDEGKSNPANARSQIQATLALYQQIYSNLLNNYESVRLSRLRGTPNIIQIEKAGVPGSPIQPRPVRNAGTGVVLGGLFIAAVAFLIEYLDDTLKTPEDVIAALGIPVIGLIGEMKPARRIREKKESVFVEETHVPQFQRRFVRSGQILNFLG